MSSYKLITKDKTIPDKTGVVLDKLNEIKSNLESLRLEIKGNKVTKLSDEKLMEFRVKFKKNYMEYDNANKMEGELTEVEQETIIGRPNDLKCLFLNIEIQTLVSRIANKLQKEEARRLKIDQNNVKNETEVIKKSVEKTYEKIEKEAANLKESVITISSLVFTAFTFIQLNFVAFQNSKDYFVLDRLLLFSGINLFLIVGIYCILSMIKTLLTIELDEKKEKQLLENLKIIIFLFSFVFTVSLVLKAREDKFLLKDIQTKVKNIENEKNNYSIENIQEKIKSLEVEMNELNIKISNSEKREEHSKNERIKLENQKLDLKNELLELKKDIIKIEKQLNNQNFKK